DKNSWLLRALTAVQFNTTNIGEEMELIKDLEIISSAAVKTSASALSKVAITMAYEGEFDGVKLLSKETWQKASAYDTPKEDLVMYTNFTFTTGGWGNGLNNEQPYGFHGWVSKFSTM